MLQDHFALLGLAEPLTYKNLTMTPLQRAGGLAADSEPDYLTLDEALDRGVVRISEVSEAGSVPELLVANSAERPLLLLDGEELVGAKQNRILNLSILVPAQTTLTIPVSCVEAGRWSDLSAEFGSLGRAQYAAGRARKARHVTASLRTAGRYSSRQDDVWADIAAKAERLGTSSPSAAMAAMYEDYQAAVDAYVAHLQPAAGQIGAVFAINGQARGLELFDHPQTFSGLLPKLVRSWALDAIDEEGTPAAGGLDAQGLLAQTAAAEVSEHPALGEGRDLRLSAPGLTGAALVARGRVVHLCAFRIDEPRQESDPRGGTRLQRASARLRRAFAGHGRR